MVVPNSTYNASGVLPCLLTLDRIVASGSAPQKGRGLEGTIQLGLWCLEGMRTPNRIIMTPDSGSPGTARPQAGSWTVGVEQALSGAASFLRLHLGLGHLW